MNNILLIGEHPIRENIIKQYETMACEIESYPNFASLPIVTSFLELCILPGEDTADHDTLQALEDFAKAYPEIPPEQSKPICHLLLHDKVTLWLLRTLNLYPEIHKKFELYAFTMEDQWAKNVLCGLGDNGFNYPTLDWEMINEASNKTVHLVIVGFSDLCESLSIHTALIAHYPNYVRNHALRTRITIVDENLSTRQDSFIQRYAELFEQSYYRCIDLGQSIMTQHHEPTYRSSREDFVDVEWEFVDGSFFDPLMQHKLKLWSESKEQLLTIALCDANCSKNFDRAFALPRPIYDNNIPVLVYTKQSALLNKVHETENYLNLFPMGMEDQGYDVRLPLLQMAKRLNYCYTYCYNQKGMPTDLPVNELEKEWKKLESFTIRYSNMYNVMTIATKMRSLGHEKKEWDKYFALTQEEIEQISAVEHNRWSVERLILGFRPPTNTEHEEIRQNIDAYLKAEKTNGEPPKQDLKELYKKHKVHYDLCSYRELLKDRTGQNVRVYDSDLTACIPLIAQSYYEAMP